MTGGANGTRDVRHPDVKMAFQFRKVGLASAMAVVLLAIVLSSPGSSARSSSRRGGGADVTLDADRPASSIVDGRASAKYASLVIGCVVAAAAARRRRSWPR